MMTYVSILWTYSHFPSFGSLRPVKTNDMYTNIRCHDLLKVTIILWFYFQHFDHSRSLDSFCTLSSSSWLHLGVPNLTALLQDWMHQSLKSYSFHVLNLSYLLKHHFFWGRNRNEANDLVNCIPERNHNWILKHSILFYSIWLLCQQSW